MKTGVLQPRVMATSGVYTGAGVSVRALEVPALVAPTTGVAIETVAVSESQEIQTHAALNATPTIKHSLCRDDQAKSVIDREPSSTGGLVGRVAIGAVGSIAAAWGFGELVQLGVPLLAGIVTFLPALYGMVSGVTGSFDVRRWGKDILPSYPTLYTEGYSDVQWRMLVERTMLYDPARKESFSKHATARLKRRLREHRINFKHFRNERRPVKVKPDDAIATLESQDRREYVTGRDVRTIFAWREDYRAVADFAAIAWAVRAMGKKLDLSFLDYESPAEFFEEFAHMMTGVRIPNKVDPSQISTEYTTDYVRLRQSIDAYAQAKEMPTPEVAAAAFLMRYFKCTGAGDYADILLEGMREYLEGKPDMLQRAHAEIAEKLRASADMTTEQEAVAALHEQLS